MGHSVPNIVFNLEENKCKIIVFEKACGKV